MLLSMAAHSLRWYSSGWRICGLFLSRSSLVPLYPEHQTSTGALLQFVTVLSLYVFMVYPGTYLIFTIVLEEWLQYLHRLNSVPQKMSAIWSHGTVCHSAVLCCVKTQIVVVSWSVSNMETWKILCMWLFILCNAHLPSLSLSFSSAKAL
jgi:hypothetical protein